MSIDAILTQLLMGLTVGVNLVLVATGLTLVFGMMGVINFAHSALFMLGAYVGLVATTRLGSFWLGLLIVPRRDRLPRRPLRERYPLSHLLPLLLTFGLSLFFEGSAKVIWGADIVSLNKPALLGGAVSLGRITFPTYWLFALAAAAVLAAAVWLVVERTWLGLAIRAATQDPTMAAVLGINVQRLNTIVFALGSGLAGAAGVILGTMTSLSPQMGAGIVLDAFIAIVIGGLGSFTGAIVGSLLLGQVQSFGVALLPAFHTPLIFLVIAVVLVLRPSGLFRCGGAPVRRLTVALVAAALILAPLGVGRRVLGVLPEPLDVGTSIFALFAAALDLALGYGGLVSFGHARFFGAGAYGAALALRHVSFSLWAALLIGIAAAALLAVVVGYFAVHSRGIYMAMLTFAFAQLLYEVRAAPRRCGACRWSPRASPSGSDSKGGKTRLRVS